MNRVLPTVRNANKDRKRTGNKTPSNAAPKAGVREKRHMTRQDRNNLAAEDSQRLTLCKAIFSEMTKHKWRMTNASHRVCGRDHLHAVDFHQGRLSF